MTRKNKKRIIIDTNLWISYLIGQKLQKLTTLIGNGKIELVFSQQLLDEIKLVTSRPKFIKYFPQKEVEALLSFMQLIGKTYELKNIPQRCRDPKDDYLLELSVCSKAHYLITGDKDLLEIVEINTCKIITIAEFEKVING